MNSKSTYFQIRLRFDTNKCPTPKSRRGGLDSIFQSNEKGATIYRETSTFSIPFLAREVRLVPLRFQDLDQAILDLWSLYLGKGGSLTLVIAMQVTTPINSSSILPVMLYSSSFASTIRIAGLIYRIASIVFVVPRVSPKQVVEL
jgi:hypothetical protein